MVTLFYLFTALLIFNYIVSIGILPHCLNKVIIENDAIPEMLVKIQNMHYKLGFFGITFAGAAVLFQKWILLSILFAAKAIIILLDSVYQNYLFLRIIYAIKKPHE